MSTSTDAYLCFGVKVPEEFIEAFEGQGDEDEYEAEKLRNPLGYMTYSGEDETVNGITITLVCHQSDDYPEYIVAPKGSVTWAWRGEPQEVKSLEVAASWPAAIQAFCEKHKIPFERPRWLLASYWG